MGEDNYFVKRRHGNMEGNLNKSDKAKIHRGCYIDICGNITIKDHAEISNDVYIFTHKHHWKHSIGLRRDTQILEPIDLVIEEDAFIGVRSIIYGVERIGKGAIVGAGSVLTKSVPNYEIWAGNPAKKIGERKKEKK